MSPRTSLLFVGHDASRTGAPTVGLAFLRWLERHGHTDVRIHLIRGGPLLGAHQALAPTSIAPRWAAAAAQARRSIGDPMPRFAARAWGVVDATTRARRPSPGVVIANTLAALPTAIRLAGAAPLVAWVHELDGVANRILPPADRVRTVGRVDRFIAAGRAVEAMLVHRWGVPEDRVCCVDAFVDPPPEGFRPENRELEILGAGSLVPRKGAIEFMATVSLVAQARPETRAAWVGGDTKGSAYRQELDHDHGRNHGAGRLSFVPEVDDLRPWWPEHGLLLHLPREDPFPLVVIEAALRGVPVVTWDTGGAADLLRRAGLGHLVVAPGDVFAAAVLVESVLDDPGGAAAMGDALRVEAAAHTTDVLAPEIWQLCRTAGRR